MPASIHQCCYKISRRTTCSSGTAVRLPWISSICSIESTECASFQRRRGDSVHSSVARFLGALVHTFVGGPQWRRQKNLLPGYNRSTIIYNRVHGVARSSAKDARIEALQVPNGGRVWGGGFWGGSSAPSPENFSILVSRKAYFGAFCGPSEVLSADCTAAFCTVIYSADGISTHKIRERTYSFQNSSFTL